MNQRTYHRVDGFDIEVKQSRTGLLLAFTREADHTVSIGVDGSGNIFGETSVGGVANLDQLKPIHKASFNAVSAMKAAIQERRDGLGSVIPL